MSRATWIAFRSATAIGLTLLTILVFRPEQPFRSVLAAALTVALPTFRASAMRQRLLLVWATGILGMLLDAFFRDAPWFYLGFIVLIATGLLIVASRSRDLATLTLVAYGLSGSLPGGYEPQSMPILEGFYRSLNISIGIICSAIAFQIFPLRKPPSHTLAKRINFPVRDTFFIALSGALSIIVVKIFSGPVISTFCVFGALTWSIKLCTQSRDLLIRDFIGRVLGVLASVAFVIIVCFSTNHPLPYLIAYSGIAWMIVWVSNTYPRHSSVCTSLLILFLATSMMSPKPYESFHMPLRIAFSIFVGMGCATLLWLIDRPLRAVERVAEMGVRG
jgi:uncharacterized membrane protein YccC